jgi:hypothetical protein
MWGSLWGCYRSDAAGVRPAKPVSSSHYVTTLKGEILPAARDLARKADWTPTISASRSGRAMRAARSYAIRPERTGIPVSVGWLA